MSDVLRERVLRAAADWVWVPPDAEDVVRAEYRLTKYPDRTSVQWSATERPVPDLIAEVRELVRGTNHPLRWWVNGRTKPEQTAEVLRQHGFELVESVEVLALELVSPEQVVAALNPPEDVDVRPADTEDAIRTAAEIDADVFDWGPITPEQLAAELAELAATGEPQRYIAHLDGRPVGAGGLTLVDDVARLWGAGVRREARGRGAYRALLAARCLHALRAGATLALVKGRTDTSAPILRTSGFTPYGREHCYQEKPSEGSAAAH